MIEGAGPWPVGARFGPEGLSVAGVAAEELAERFGTPLLVVDECELRERCRALASLYPRALYAVKALTARAPIRIALEEGLGLLVSTDGEMEACLRAGAPAREIAFHGNNKSDRELELAVAAGVGLVVADGAEELDRLDRVAREAGAAQPVLLRVIPEVEAGTHPAVETGAAGSKFGTPLPLAVEAVKRAVALPGVRFRGIHAHIGSQVVRPDPYLAEIDALLDLSAELRASLDVAVEVVDLGGGFGVTYTDEAPTPASQLAAALLERVRVGAASRRLPVPEVIVEPGRWVVANAAITLYRVGQVKEGAAGRALVAVDGGMSDNIRPMLYGARYAVAVAGPPREADPTPADVVGRHCESADVLAEGVELPADVGPGDLLAFAGTGAYTYSMASTYNRVGRSAVVAVRDGASRVWLRREDAADLDRLEVGDAGAIPEAPSVEGVLVRPARPEDARSFLDVYRAVVEERRFIRTERVNRSARFYRRRFRRSWTKDEAHLVAVADGRVIGQLSIHRDDQPVTRHAATLGMLVDAAWRGKGVGSALLSEALRWARAMGVERVVLSVFPHNAPAIALYRKFGFADEGRLVRHSRKSYGYEDEILMARWLGEEG